MHDTPINQAAPGVLNNDTDADGDPMTATLVTGPSHAQSFAFNPDGSFSYVPTTRYVGEDSFTYKVWDGIVDSNIATVRINVYNNPPVVQNDGPYYVGFVDNQTPPPLIVAAPGVLGNDTDPDSDYPLTAILYSGPSLGTLEYFNPDGSFKYIPNPGYLGEDSFQYVANDGITNSSFVGTVNVTSYRVDAMIYDGQDGAQVAYQVEESRGAFTVANLNDTDNDGVQDRNDADGVVATPAGRNEVDLMRLDIARPYAGFEGTMTLTVPSGGINCWRESTRVNRVPLNDGGDIQLSEADFPPTGDMTLWAEAYSPSDSIRDMVINLTYRSFTDTVKATGVWASLTALEDDTKTANQRICARDTVAEHADASPGCTRELRGDRAKAD